MNSFDSLIAAIVLTFVSGLIGAFIIGVPLWIICAIAGVPDLFPFSHLFTIALLIVGTFIIFGKLFDFLN
jgi:hypothetical protein